MATTLTWTGERKKSNDCLMELAFGASGGGGSASAGNQTSGAQKTQVVNSSGVSMPGDATNGFDVDVTRLSALVAGSALIGKVGIDQTTPGTTNAVSIQGFKGAANKATGQVATSTTAATFVIARATRRSVLLRNLDATISVYYGPAAVTSSNGMLLKAGESVSEDWVGLIQVIAASGTPTVAYSDSYD